MERMGFTRLTRGKNIVEEREEFAVLGEKFFKAISDGEKGIGLVLDQLGLSRDREGCIYPDIFLSADGAESVYVSTLHPVWVFWDDQMELYLCRSSAYYNIKHGTHWVDLTYRLMTEGFRNPENQHGTLREDLRMFCFGDAEKPAADRFVIWIYQQKFTGLSRLRQLLLQHKDRDFLCRDSYFKALMNQYHSNAER